MSETRDQNEDGNRQCGDSSPPQPGSQPGYESAPNGDPDTAPPNYNNLGEDGEVKKTDTTAQRIWKSFIEKSDYAPPDYNKLREDDEVKVFDFTAKNERIAFIRKVYSILTCQLLMTRNIVALFVPYDPLSETATPFYHYTTWLFWVPIAVAIGCMIMTRYWGNVLRKAPKNLIVLGIFTLVEGFLFGIVSNILYSDAILTVVTIMAVVCFTLTVFALQTKWSFNTFGAILLSTIVVLLIFNINVMTVRTYKVMVLFCASLCALLFSICLVYDTQLMVDGKHKYSISHEEYVFAVLILSQEIIAVYPFIPAIIGACRNKNEAQTNGQAVQG